LLTVKGKHGQYIPNSPALVEWGRFPTKIREGSPSLEVVFPHLLPLLLSEDMFECCLSLLNLSLYSSGTITFMFRQRSREWLTRPSEVSKASYSTSFSCFAQRKFCLFEQELLSRWCSRNEWCLPRKDTALEEQDASCCSKTSSCNSLSFLQ
jgi:hypothetical protein